MRMETLIIYASENGREDWAPVKPADVPAWVVQPDVLAAMANGEECINCAEGLKGSKWYRAIRAEELEKPVETPWN